MGGAHANEACPGLALPLLTQSRAASGELCLLQRSKRADVDSRSLSPFEQQSTTGRVQGRAGLCAHYEQQRPSLFDNLACKAESFWLGCLVRARVCDRLTEMGRILCPGAVHQNHLDADLEAGKQNDGIVELCLLPHGYHCAGPLCLPFPSRTDRLGHIEVSPGPQGRGSQVDSALERRERA